MDRTDEDRAAWVRVDLVGVRDRWHVVSGRPAEALCGLSVGGHRPLRGILAAEFIDGKWPCQECRAALLAQSA